MRGMASKELAEVLSEQHGGQRSRRAILERRTVSEQRRGSIVRRVAPEGPHEKACGAVQRFQRSRPKCSLTQRPTWPLGTARVPTFGQAFAGGALRGIAPIPGPPGFIANLGARFELRVVFFDSLDAFFAPGDLIRASHPPHETDRAEIAS